ncbi:MAG: MotA/TolQ/ExbB proton channel family protein [Halothiobacillaceae bacterium]
MSVLWQQGDVVSRATLLILLGMSCLSWTVILIKSFDLFRLSRQAARVDAHFWESHDLESGASLLGQPGTPFHALYLEATQAMAHHTAHPQHLHTRLDLGDWMARGLKMTLEETAARIQSGLAVLASIGSTAPFVGLFGTVWGIYRALMAIGASSQAGLNQVAGPIGEALVMTALGLFVAIPAVLGYNALTRAARSQVAKLTRFANGLHALLLTGANPAALKPAPRLKAVVARSA